MKIGGAAGTAALAMYTALGPAGLAIAGVTGLVAGIVGIEEAMQKINAEAIGNTIRDANGKKDAMNEAIEIVKQAAAEYNNTIIDGKYCFQTCACTEKCDKCIRLCNGDIDWYENIDNWAEEYNNGWIPCSEPPKDDRYVLLSFDNFSVPMVGRYEEDEKGGSYYIGDEMEPCVTQDIFVNAWQPLPESYQQKGE